MSVVPLSEQIYRDMVGHIENFLAGVTLLNERIISDAIQTAKDFYNALDITLPPPPPPPSEEEEIIPQDDPETRPVVTLPQAFIEGLEFEDFKTGGKRTRATSFGLLTWEVPFQFTLDGTTFQIRQWSSSTSSWKFFSSKTTNLAGAINTVNEFRVTHKAQAVKEFKPTTSYFWYLII